MFKIVITGPESTGKSTLSKQLANHFNFIMVEEYSRTYLQNLSLDYTQQDLSEIAKGQMELEDKALEHRTKFMICDTSLEVIKIWSEFKYGDCASFITTSLQKRQPDLYLLLRPDLPWEADPMRENPHDREQLFELYKNELIASKVPFYEISGNRNERQNLAIDVITNYL